MNDLGLALIARDEQDSLPVLLASITGAFDCVTLTDTGSRDRTIPIFQDWAAAEQEQAAAAGRTFTSGTQTIEWPGDFAAARTSSYEHLHQVAPPDVGWFCWADCDDEIRGAQNLRGIAASLLPEVVMAVFDYDYARTPDGACVCRLRRERLTRRGQTEWVGRVHEAQLPTTPGATTLVPPDVAVWVHRRQEIGGRDPGERNLKILRKWDRDEPDTPRIIGYLGSENLARGRHTQARRYFRRYLRLRTGWDEERAQVHRKLAISCLALAGTEGAPRDKLIAEAERAAFESLQLLPSWPDSYLTLAEVAHQRGEWSKAIEWATRVRELGTPETLLIVNPLDYTAQPLALTADSYGMMSRWEDAVAAGEAAIQAGAAHPELGRKVMAWRGERKRENTADTYAMMIEQHLSHDEQLNALAIAEAAPVFVKDHPKVVQARILVRERLRWLLEDRQAGTRTGYQEHYTTGGSKPEDFLPDDRALEVAAQLPRAHFALGQAQELAASRAQAARNGLPQSQEGKPLDQD